MGAGGQCSSWEQKKYEVGAMIGFIVGILIGALGTVVLIERKVEKSEDKGDEV